MLDVDLQTFDDEAIELLGRVPSPFVVLGIQSIKEEAMQNIRRKYHVPSITDNIQKLLRYPHMTMGLEFILGLPGDDYESFKSTLDWALSFEPMPKVFIYDLWVIENAPLYDVAGQFGIRTDEEGLVQGTASFSEEGVLRASLLSEVLTQCQMNDNLMRRYQALRRGNGSRPSEILEKMTESYIRAGKFSGRERIPSL